MNPSLAKNGCPDNVATNQKIIDGVASGTGLPTSFYAHMDANMEQMAKDQLHRDVTPRLKTRTPIPQLAHQ